MWRSKKLIIVVVLAAVVLVGSIGRVVLANGDENQPKAQFGEFIDKACDIYDENVEPDIDRDALQAAIAQAQSEMQAAAMEARLAKMVENGVIDETQAQELQEWWESRPDISILAAGPLAPGFPGHGIHRGFGRPGGFEPPSPPE